jgi:hypothetical protein
MKHNEYHLQKQVCQYLEFQYPNVLFLSDTIANLRLSLPQAVRNKGIQKQGFRCPDLIILCPKDEWHGLLIELKIETVFNKKGELKSQHLKEQKKSLIELGMYGYCASFAVGFDEAKQLIDNYLSL